VEAVTEERSGAFLLHRTCNIGYVLVDCDNMTQRQYTTATITKIPGSQVEIKGVIAASIFDTYKKAALTSIGKEISIPGFRKGAVPEKMLISKIGMGTILEEMAEIALSKAYPEILITEKVDAIGRPKITITKLAEGNDFEFTITTAVVPEVTLPDYKKIAQDITAKPIKPEEVTDAEVEKVINSLRREVAHSHVHEHGDDDHSHENEDSHEKAIDAAMPEFNDEFVKSLGKFESTKDFTDKLRENLAKEKVEKAQEKRRIEIADALLEATTIDIPEVLIESEISRIEMQFTDDIARIGATMDEYLKHINKSLEDLRKDWRPSAEKKAKLQIILNNIAQAEKVKIPEATIAEHVERITKTYKDADKERAWIFAETFLTNEKVFELLSENK
jgi:trigger factor